MAFLSKTKRELLAQKVTAQSALQAVMAKEGATAKEISDATASLEAANSKLSAQNVIETGQEFGEDGQELVHADGTASKHTDKFSSMEYRQAFMDYVKTGQSASILEFKSADASTAVADVAAIVPSTILQEVIKKVETYGQVYARVRKLSIAGGVSVPILSVKPVATWIGENTSSDRQKANLTDSVTFTYYGLECKIATSIIANAVTIESFEAIIIDLIGEAMTKALDIAIISGTGVKQFLGITKDTRIPATKTVTLTPTEFKSWESWKKKVFAKLSAGYKSGATFLMASGTFEGYIDGMVDTNGQPIGRVNYGITNGPQDTFGGKQVIEVEDDVVANYDDAAAGDIVAIYGNLNNFAVNSNMQLTMFRYLDHDKNEWIDKAILIADGKVLDPNAFVIVKKGAAA